MRSVWQVSCDFFWIGISVFIATWFMSGERFMLIMLGVMWIVLGIVNLYIHND